MIREEAREYCISLVKQLIDSYHFDDFLEDRTSRKFCNWRREYMSNVNSGLGISACADEGVTKGVIILPQIGYVIKFPFEGKDYCLIEKQNYDKAKEEGLDSLFAWCDILGQTSKGINFYIMEYAEVDESRFESTITDLYPELAEEYDYDLTCCECVADMLSYEWGFDVYQRFNHFAEREDINDIHGVNVGETDRGWVVIDYSGFCGWED